MSKISNNLIFITGNPHKAAYLAKWLKIDIPHRKLDLEELQSLDLRQIVKHKARSAYAQVGQPVLVEDVALTFHALGRLPGPLVKWFLEELTPAGLPGLLADRDDKTATASIMYGLYDGQALHVFEGHIHGTVAPVPRSSQVSGWNAPTSWNSVFIPDGSSRTYAEMTDEELKPFSHRAAAIEKLQAFLSD